MKLSAIVQEAHFIQKTEGVREAARDFADLGKAQRATADTAEIFTRQTTAQERAITRVASKLEQFTRQHDPLSKAQRDVERGEALIAAARARGIEVTTQHTVALDRARRRMEDISGAMNDNAKAVGLSRHEWVNLGRQIQDVGTMAAMGQSPLAILTSQGAQIADAFASSGAGAGAALKDFGGSVARFALNPVVLLGGALAVAGAAAFRFDEQQRALKRSLNGVGRAAGVTAEDLRRVALAGASAGNMTAGEGIGAAAQLASSGRLRASTIQSLIPDSRRYGRAFGLDEADALKELGDAFADPTRGAEALDKRLGFLDAAGRDLIRTLQDQGDLYGAQVALLNRFEASLSKTRDTTLGVVDAWQKFKAGFMNPVETIGGAIDRLFTAPVSAQERIRQRAAAMARAQELRAIEGSRTASDMISGLVPENASRRDLVNQRTRLADLLGDPEVRKRLGAASADADKALAILTTRVETWKSALEQAQEDAALAIQEISARSFAERSAVASQRAYVETLRQTGDASRAALAAESARAKMVAESARKADDMLRSAQDQNQLVRLTPYERRMKEIEFKYRDARQELVPNAATPMAREFDTAATAARNVAEAFNGLASNAKSGFGRLIPLSEWQAPSRVPMFAQGGGSSLHNAIIRAEGTGRYGDPYNTSLGYLRSPRPLTQMTMAESLAWGDHIRKGTDIGRRTNSSAKGAFQIVNQTQRAAMRALGFGENDLFDEAHQQAMADWIFKTQGIGAWEGFKRRGGNDNALPMMARARPGQRQAAATPDVGGKLRRAEAEDTDAARFETIVKPLQDANAEIDRQRSLLRAQAGAFGESAEATARAAKQQELLNQFETQHIPITDALRASISATADNYARLTAEQEDVARSQQRMIENFDLVRSSASEALGSFASDMLRGESAAKSLENQLQRIADRLISLAADRAIENIFGRMGSANLGGGGGFFGGIASWLGSLFKFEKGGVMSSSGPLPLRAYSSGGVATSPQLALYGEGRMPEAYVPLPDGRTIPVSLRLPPALARARPGDPPPRPTVIVQQAAAGAMRVANENREAASSGGNYVTIIDQRGANAPPVQTRETVDARGRRRTEVVIQEQFAGAANSPRGMEALRMANGGRGPLTRR